MSTDHTMEDFHIGQKFSGGPVTVTAEEIIAFARKYDPQDFHIHPEKAADTAAGEHIASGWHTASLTMRMIVDAMPKIKGGMIGRSVEKMRWPRPVRPGDSLSMEGEILDLRASASNPLRGILRVRNATYNQDREVVLEMETVIFVPRKSPLSRPAGEG